MTVYIEKQLHYRAIVGRSLDGNCYCRQVSDGPTAEERQRVERALGETGAARESLLRAFDARDRLALAAMVREAAIAYTDVAVRLGPTSQVLRDGQSMRLRYDTLQWMFDFLVRASLKGNGPSQE